MTAHAEIGRSFEIATGAHPLKYAYMSTLPHWQNRRGVATVSTSMNKKLELSPAAISLVAARFKVMGSPFV